MTDIGEPTLVRASAIEVARGTVLAGRYQIEAVLGKGGSGIVLRAFDRVAQVPVALKLLKPDLATDPRWVERFSRELRLARQIQHPNVCRVFDIGQADGHWFITMELAVDGTLRDQLGDHSKQRSLEDRAADVRAIVAGLAAIHGAGIVHRDVKPDNFLRMPDGRLVLSDFGLATNPGDAPIVSVMVGTPHYMAPEVIMGEAASPRSDVWSAGVVIHEILLGARPARQFHRNDTVAVPSSATRGEATILEGCLSALANDPADRPADGADLARLVEAALSDAPSRRTGRTGSRLRGQALWGVTAVAVLATGAVFAKRLWTPAEAFNGDDRPATAVITTAGEPRDWTIGTKVVSTFDERVHCFSILPGGEIGRVVVGTPRRAEEINLTTGERARAPLAPATYAFDCPQLSPNGHSLLYTNVPSGASPQIIRSNPDGTNPTPMTSGREPLWLPSGDEFVFEPADSHVGVFSIPTMRYALLADNRGQQNRYLYKKALSASGNVVAVTYQGEGADLLLEVHALPALQIVGSWLLPTDIRGLDFFRDDLFLSKNTNGGAFAKVDWRAGSSRRLGYVPGRVIQAVEPLPGGDRLVVSTTNDRDVWLFDPSAPNQAPKQITSDGNNLAVSWSPSGQMLVEKLLENNQYVIFLYDRNGQSKQVTNGPLDGVPSFAGASSTWVYADYARKAIVRCVDAGNCTDVLQGDRLIDWPVMAPDQKRIAFITALGVPRVHVMTSGGKSEIDLGSTAIECPPLWTSPSSLWAFSGAGNHRYWEEIDVPSAKRTGRVKDATTFSADERRCGWDRSPQSPFYQRAQVIVHETWRAARGAMASNLD